MATYWYVLQVLTGHELEVRNALQRERLKAKVPHANMPIRRRGAWAEKTEVFFPGYVFIGCEQLTANIYYTATSITGVLCFLGGPKAQPITDAEVEHLLCFAMNNDPLLPSTVRVEGDEFTITSGRLARYGADIIKLERRRRRAKVELPFLGEKRVIAFPIQLEEDEDGRTEKIQAQKSPDSL